MSPAQLAALHPERRGELEQPVHDMLVGCRGHALVAKEPLTVPRPRPIEPQAHLRGHQETDEVRAHRCVHMQHDIEASAPEFAPNVEIAAQAPGLVEDHELDALESCQERVLDLGL